MKNLQFLYSLLFFLCSLPVRANDTDSLLLVLDKSIEKRNIYSEKRSEEFSRLKKELKSNASLQEKFWLSGELFEQYKSYQLDSALVYANKRMEIALQVGDSSFIQYARLNVAEALMICGMYKEALDILQAETEKPWEDDHRAYIYHLYHSLYMLLADYTLSTQEKEEYIALEYQYKDSILKILTPDALGYKLIMSANLVGKGEWTDALKNAEETYRMYTEPREIAFAAYTLSEVYHAMGDDKNRKKFLIISAIGDIQSGVKEYISLWQVARILYGEGDIDRAYNYVKCSMEDAIFCNARYRALEISRLLPLINDTYDIKMKEEKQKLILFLAIISVLSVILVLATIFIFRQLKALIRARKSLKNINEDLRKMNDNLNALNMELSESNVVKEEYIGSVFSLCSAYIDKLEDFRKKVNRKLKAGQNKDLLVLTDTSSLVNDELRELYHNFDLMFLNLYPDFIEDFNTLLHDGEHILPKEGELMTPELRIYALVRLGINDSVKIAAFLHYSPQTVYNYRLKTRNKAKVSRENFPEAVRQLGRLRHPE